MSESNSQGQAAQSSGQGTPQQGQQGQQQGQQQAQAPTWQKVFNQANEPAQGASGGSAQQTPGQSQQSAVQSQASGEPSSGAGQTPPAGASQQPNVVQFDEARLQQLIAGVAQAAQPAQQQAPITREQLEQMFNVYNVAAEQLQALGLEPTEDRVKLMNSMFQGVARQAATISQFQVQAVVEQLVKRLAPLEGYLQQQAEAKLRDRFFEKHKDLEKFEPLLLKIADSMKASGRMKDFKGEDELFEAVATEAKSIIKSMGVDPAAIATAQQGQQQTGQRTSRMPALSGGGQGGAGDGAGGQQNQPTWRKVYRG